MPGQEQNGPPPLMQRLAAVPRRQTEFNHPDFSTSVNTTNERSVVASLQADGPLAVMGARANPFRLAIPAYETFTTNGTAGDTETFNLSNDLVDTPNTQPIVLWLDGSYYGEPDAVDYANNTFDVTDAGTGSTVHAYYVSGDAATVTLRKRSADGDAQETIFTANTGVIHTTDQSEQPEVLRFNHQLERFVGTDQFLEVTVDAPFTVRFDEDTDDTNATNALLGLSVQRGQAPVSGLPQAVKAAMGRT